MANPIYIVICGHSEPYVAERNLADMGREETILQLSRGEWTYNGRCSVSSIIEVGTDKDVTDEFMTAARLLKEADAAPIDRQAAAWDHVRDLRKHEAV